MEEEEKEEKEKGTTDNQIDAVCALNMHRPFYAERGMSNFMRGCCARLELVGTKYFLYGKILTLEVTFHHFYFLN